MSSQKRKKIVKPDDTIDLTSDSDESAIGCSPNINDVNATIDLTSDSENDVLQSLKNSRKKYKIESSP